MAMIPKNRISSTPRRREVRRHIRGNRPAGNALAQLWHPRIAWVLFFVIATGSLASMVALIADKGPHFTEAQYLTTPVVARTKFTALDDAKTLQKQEYARQLSPSHYRADTSYLSQLREELESIGRYGADENIQSLEQIREETRHRLRLTPTVFDALKRFVEHKGPSAWSELTNQFINDYAAIAVIDSERAAIERDADKTRSYQIVITHPSGLQMERSDKDLIDVADPDDQKTLEANVLKLLNNYDRELWSTIFEVVRRDRQPTYIFDAQATAAARTLAADAVEPVQMTYQPDDVLVPSGKKLTALDLNLIANELAAFRNQQNPVVAWLTHTGRVGLVAVITFCFWGYIFAYKPRITENVMRGLALTALFVAAQILAVLVARAQPNAIFFVATFPTIAAAIILAIAYDQRFALAAGAVHGLLVMVSLDLPISFGIVLLAGIAVAVMQLAEVRNRSKLIWVGAWTGLAMAATCFLAGIATERPLELPQHLRLIAVDTLWAFGSGFFTGLVVQAALPAIESVFKITTSMTLKELNDASHPLLQRLAQLAPGTYQHSLRLADIAESAAESIGGSPLLCRVGAMFHDIGKMNKPQYFIENQGGGHNRHDKLSPAMSVLIIVGHVKDGAEMAREYGLPADLRHFIESHHGTTLVEYFFHAAKANSAETNDIAPTEFEFRYPGPKPQTKEAAILMMCDGIESAARTLREPTPARIEELVKAISRKRLMDGQFDECNLTLKEIHKIEKAITKTLCAVYHGRVAYPKDSTTTAELPESPPLPNTATNLGSPRSAAAS